MSDNNQQNIETVVLDESHVIAERREKLKAIREKGVAFPNDFKPLHQAAALHAQYGEFEGLVSIDSKHLIQGDLPPRVLGMVIEWANLYSKELNKAWEIASKGQLPQKIPPLR